jgi:hypothetical protein
MEESESTSSPDRFIPRKESRSLLNRGQCGPQSRSERFGEFWDKFPSLVRIRTPDRLARSLAIILTELFWLFNILAFPMKICEGSLIMGELFFTSQKTLICLSEFFAQLNHYQTFRAILHCTVRKRWTVLENPRRTDFRGVWSVQVHY